MAVCPHCGDSVTHVDIEKVVLQSTPLNRYAGLSYSCPACNRVLSVTFDPSVQADDIVGRLKK